MKASNCLVVLELTDGSFVSISDPMRLVGYRAKETWFFGNPATEKEKELYKNAAMIVAACNSAFFQAT